MKTIRTLIYFVMALGWIYLGFHTAQYGWFSVYVFYVIVTVLCIGWLVILNVKEL
jgi:hypothetical protein